MVSSRLLHGETISTSIALAQSQYCTPSAALEVALHGHRIRNNITIGSCPQIDIAGGISPTTRRHAPTAWTRRSATNLISFIWFSSGEFDVLTLGPWDIMCHLRKREVGDWIGQTL